MTPEQQAAIDLLAQMSPQERLVAIARRQSERAVAAETAKPAPLKQTSLGPAIWATHKKHLLDGGGTWDAAAIGRAMVQALLDDDQANHWPALLHYLKACLLRDGIVTVDGNGAVALIGVAPTPAAQP